MENQNIKCWLIKARGPYVGAEEYYGAYSEQNPIDILDSSDLDVIFDELYSAFSFRMESEYESDWEEMSDEERECYNDDLNEYEWESFVADCDISAEEVSEDTLVDYRAEIIYDERENTSSSTGD